MHRRLIGRIGAAAALVALAVPVSLIAAAPAQGVNSCTTSMSPKVPLGQSGLSVACLLDVSATASSNANRIEVGDTPNAGWSSTGARTATVGAAALGVVTLAFTPALTAADVGRSISGSGIAGGTFIKTAAGGISRKTEAAITAGTVVTITHNRGRELNDANCSTANANLTSPSAVFAAGDAGLAVSGGPYRALARIVSVTNATTAVVDDNPSVAGNQAPSNVCSDANSTVAGVQDVITLGLVTYSPATSTTVVVNTARTRQIHIANSAPPAAQDPVGGTCAGSTITLNASGGGTFSTDVGLPVFFKKSDGTNADATVRKVNSVTATTIVMNAACPAGAAAARDAVLGVRSGSPSDGTLVAQLNASLNLNPALNPASDDCLKNTYEGFGIEGEWYNPGGYVRTAVLGGPLPVSTAQVLFPTSVVSFAGYVTYKSGGLQVGAHNEFIFPSLPTSLAVCIPNGGTITTNKTAVALKFSPTIRAIGPNVGTFTPKILAKNGNTILAPNPITGTACVIAASTTAPSYGCGDA